MKKLFYLMTIALFASCTNDEEMKILTDCTPEESVSVEKRSFQEALEVAQGAPEIFGGTTTRGELKQVTLANTQYIVGEATTRNEAPDTLMYVFNYEDNQGFAVVSANKSTEALIAVTEQGTYNEETETNNPGLALYMDMAKNYVARGGAAGNTIIGGGGGTLPITEQKEETTTSTTEYGPLLEVRWGQHSPYNTYCYTLENSYAPTGCVATVLAQIFSYVEYPTSMTINYNSNNIHTLNINWNTLKGHFSSYGNCSCNPTTHTQLAEMFRQIGKEVDMKYYSNKSEAYAADAADYLTRLGFSHTGVINYNSNTAINSLANENIVYISGKASQYGRHAWVFDGYKKIVSTTKFYTRPTGQLEWTLIRTTTATNEYYHHNWGWDGDNNGYFSNNVYQFNTANPSSLDNGVSNLKNYDFNTNVEIIANISR